MHVCLDFTFLHCQKHEREQKLVNSVTAEECFVCLFDLHWHRSICTDDRPSSHERSSAFLMPHFPIDTNFSRQATQT